MSRDNKTVYQPVDKIASVPWNFIKLVCGKHSEKHPGLVLRDSSSGPRYQCEENSCSLTFPAAVHERLLDEIIKILNIKGGLIGFAWKKRIMGHLYSFEIYEYDFETGVTVGVNRLS